MVRADMTPDGRPKYANTYSPENLYGHVVALLGTCLGDGAGLGRGDDAGDRPVLLDIAAGHAAIGEVVEAELGLHYLAVDIDAEAVESVRARGLEAHVADLARHGAVAAALEAAIAGRRVAAVTMLDGLEHLADPAEALAAVRAVAAAHDAVVVFSVPNVTHRDVGFKLALGSWRYTRTGLLDTTHLHLYGEAELTAVLEASGLHRIDRNDYRLAASDQHEPPDHPALRSGTTLHRFLSGVRDGAEPNARVNQFVWACVPGPVRSPRPPVETGAAPFLSVIMRTQGRRIAELDEALLCLAAQSCTDFEVLVIAHRVDRAQQLAIERVVDGAPEWLGERIRIVHVDHGNRATLLNAGLDAARGRYVVALDDDDLVFAHWVETFAALEQKHDGRVLRSLCGRQQSDRVRVADVPAIRASSAVDTPYASAFSFVEHLAQNSTPFMSVALPRALARDLGLRFDESLTTTEDWDYLLRAVSLVGVADAGALTAIYRFWPGEDSSITEHAYEEWQLNQYAVDRKLDSGPVLLPAGETRAIRALVRRVAEAEASAAAAARPAGLGSAATASDAEPSAVVAERLRDLDELRVRAITLLGSRSWRLSCALRLPGRLLGRGRPITPAEVASMGDAELRAAIAAIERSRSWRLTRPLRRRSARVRPVR